MTAYVYWYMTLTTVSGLITALLWVACLVMAVLGLPMVMDTEWFPKWCKVMKILFPACVLISLASCFIPSKKEAAILLSVWTVETAVKSDEGQKAIEVLRKYVIKELEGLK